MNKEQIIKINVSNIVRLYKTKGVESYQINGKWLETLMKDKSELEKEALKWGIKSNNIQGAALRQFLDTLKICAVGYYECDCLICENGQPKSLTQNNTWVEKLKIAFYVLIKQQKKHDDELKEEIKNRGYSSRKFTNREHIDFNDIIRFLYLHRFDLRLSYMEESSSRRAVSECLKENPTIFINCENILGFSGFWSLSKLEDPYKGSNDNNFNFNDCKEKYNEGKEDNYLNNDLEKENQSKDEVEDEEDDEEDDEEEDEEDDEEESDQDYENSFTSEDDEQEINENVTKNGLKMCGFIKKKGGQCHILGKCRFHQDIYGNGTTRKPTFQKITTPTKTTIVSSSRINNNSNSINKSIISNGKRKSPNNSNDKYYRDQDEEFHSYRLPNSINEDTKSHVIELVRNILSNFNFYKYIFRNFEPYGYRISVEFSRFIAIKFLFDNGNSNDIRSISTHKSNLQAPPLISEFWANIVIDTINYDKLCNILGNRLRFDPSLFEYPILYQKIRFARAIHIYLQIFDEIDDDIWVFK